VVLLVLYDLAKVDRKSIIDVLAMRDAKVEVDIHSLEAGAPRLERISLIGAHLVHKLELEQLAGRAHEVKAKSDVDLVLPCYLVVCRLKHRELGGCTHRHKLGELVDHHHDQHQEGN